MLCEREKDLEENTDWTDLADLHGSAWRMTCVYMGARDKGRGEAAASALKSQGLDVVHVARYDQATAFPRRENFIIALVKRYQNRFNENLLPMNHRDWFCGNYLRHGRCSRQSILSEALRLLLRSRR